MSSAIEFSATTPYDDLYPLGRGRFVVAARARGRDEFGPPGDQLDVEVVVKRRDAPEDMAFEFQLRPDSSEAARTGMLDTLRSAFNRDYAVRLEYSRRARPASVVSPCCQSFISPREADMARLQSRGKLTFLRVHDGGRGVWAADRPDRWRGRSQSGYPSRRGVGLRIRADSARPVRQGMLDLLRDAFSNDFTVVLDYNLDTGKSNGVVIRVALER